MLGQTVKHAHIHIIPKFEETSIQIKESEGFCYYRLGNLIKCLLRATASHGSRDESRSRRI